MSVITLSADQCIVVRRRETDAQGPLLSYEEVKDWDAVIDILDGNGLAVSDELKLNIQSHTESRIKVRAKEFIGIGPKGIIEAPVIYLIDVANPERKKALRKLSHEELAASRAPLPRPELPWYCQIAREQKTT